MGSHLPALCANKNIYNWTFFFTQSKEIYPCVTFAELTKSPKWNVGSTAFLTKFIKFLLTRQLTKMSMGIVEVEVNWLPFTVFVKFTMFTVNKMFSSFIKFV